jgi:hypothetical protein
MREMASVFKMWSESLKGRDIGVDGENILV